MDKIAESKIGEDKVKASVYDELDSAQKTYNEAGRIISDIIDDVSKNIFTFLYYVVYFK